MTDVDVPADALDGCTVVVTRERRGELGRRLDELGASVIHVPLIRVVDPAPPDGERLASALRGELDWLVVTSAAGADRVGALGTRPDVRLAAVGTATARRLSEVVGREVDLVPPRQTASALVEAFRDVAAPPGRVVVAQADRAADTLAAGLHAQGHDVEVVTAYRTELRSPSADELHSIAHADAVLFASGSAATGWAEALGDVASGTTPPIVAVIGPSTCDAARRAGLKVSHQATDHSLDGLIRTLVEAWRSRGPC